MPSLGSPLRRLSVALGAGLLVLSGACASSEDAGDPDAVGAAGWEHVRSTLSADEADLAILQRDGEAFVTPWVDSPVPFEELLVSWNLRRPTPGAAAVIQARVLGIHDQAPGPWLLLGTLGAEGLADAELVKRCGPLVIATPGGRVHVDVLKAHHGGGRAWERAQVRVVGVDTDGDGLSRLGIARLDLVFSARGDRTADARPPARTAPRLAVPFRSQGAEDPVIAGRICSPTSLAMTLQYHGVDEPTVAVAARVFDARHDLYGNWPRAIQAAFELGIPGYLDRFSDWEAVRREIEGGRPLVISLAAEPGQLTGAPLDSTAGHLVVVAGFDEAGDVEVCDPAADDAATGMVVYSREELTVCWMERGGTAYVLAPPPY